MEMFNNIQNNSLPSPPLNIIKEIAGMCIEFILNGKRHQIKKDILYQRVENGSFNLINLVTFNYSFKMIQYTPEWAEFAEMYRVHIITQTDILHYVTLIRKCTNSFWKDLMESYMKWYTVEWLIFPCDNFPYFFILGFSRF